MSLGSTQQQLDMLRYDGREDTTVYDLQDEAIDEFQKVIMASGLPVTMEEANSMNVKWASIYGTLLMYNMPTSCATVRCILYSLQDPEKKNGTAHL